MTCLMMRTLVAFCAMAAAISLIDCGSGDDEEKINRLVASGARLAEAHDTAGILDLATADVLAMPNGLGRREIRAYLWRTFKYYGPLHVHYPRPTIEIEEDGQRARTGFPFLIVRKEKRLPGLDMLRDDPMAWFEAIGENADLYRMDLDLIRQDGDWRVDRVTVERHVGR